MQFEQRRNVVFLESAAAMGGVQFSTLYVARGLDDSRWHPVVICPAEGDLTDACRDAGVETHVLAWPRFWSTSVRVGRKSRLPNPFAWIWNASVMLRAARSLKLFLKQAAPDVLVTKGLQSHFIGGLAARNVRVPCVWHVQDLISERTFGIYRRVFAFAARRLPHLIIADGHAIKDQLPQSIHSRVSVVHNGIDTTVFHPNCDGAKVREEFGIVPGHIVIGHAGRITPWKGQHYLIEAFAQIANEFPNTVLLLAGSPVFDTAAYERRLQAMATEFGLRDRIIFAGYRHDLENVLSAMDIFAFTSTEKDTSPLALLSAMATGLPIVAFSIEGVRELFADDSSVMTVPVGDSRGIAKALSALLSDAQLRLKLGQHARIVAQENFSLDRFVAQVEEVLCDAGGLSSPHSAPAIKPSLDKERPMVSSPSDRSAATAVGS
jgi:glycosyltransferase involved in cell wall biosynthesis